MNQIDITIFETTTGRIIRTVSCPKNMINIQCRNGEEFVFFHHNIYTHYILTAFGNTPIKRPTMPGALNKPQILADGNDLATISNLPQPCTVTFAGQTYEVEDGCFAFTVDVPGTYTVRVEAWPHLDAEFVVEGVEA